MDLYIYQCDWKGDASLIGFVKGKRVLVCWDIIWIFINYMHVFKRKDIIKSGVCGFFLVTIKGKGKKKEEKEGTIEIPR